MRPTLSICIITQDQAARLPQALGQASVVADEVVVVDGGSSDGTAEVVLRYPNTRLIQRPFDGNFAKQRNAAFDAARGDWMFVLDTDELMGPNLLRILPALLSSRFRSASFPRYWLGREEPPLYVDGPNLYPDPSYRLFRNEPDLRYDPERPIHEAIPRERLRPRLRLRRCHLLHYSFLWESAADRERKRRRYDAIDPSLQAANRVHASEDPAHRLRDCREAWVAGRPFVASASDYRRDRLRLAWKNFRSPLVPGR